MNVRHLGMSQLAKDAGFGTRIWSEGGYWGGRFYHLIVAIGTAVILAASIIQYGSTSLLVLLLSGYGLYLLARFCIRGHEPAYYRPLIQFARAQVAIGTLTLVIAHLGEAGDRGYLWLLYSLQLMIIGRHMSSGLFLFSIVEVWIILVGLRVASASSLASFIQANPDLLVQCTWIALIGFVIHYLLRNIDARDGTISTVSQINALARQQLTGGERDANWEAVLDTYLRNVGGQRGSVWLCNQHTGQVRPLTRLSHRLGESCLADSPSDPVESISVDTDNPIAQVVRTAQPLYCRAQARLGDWLPRSRQVVQICTLPPDVYARILVPIGERSNGRGPVLGVLCVDFDRARPPRERLLPQYFEFLGNMADWFVPLLQFVRQIEDQQTLRHIGVQVSSSLRLKNVLDETLNALTGPLGFELATISLVDEDAQIIRCEAGRNVPQEWIDLACHPLSGADIQADVVRRREMEIINGWDERFDQRIYKQFHHDRLIRAFVPIRRLRASDGQPPPVHGVVEVGYHLDNQEQITPDQQALLVTFVDQVAVAIEKARLFQDTLQQRQVLKQLHQVSHDIACARHPDQVLEHLGQALRGVLDADIVMIYRHDRATQTIEPPLIFGQVWGRRPLKRAPLDGGIIAEILHTGRPCYAADATDHPLLNEPYSPQIMEKTTERRRTFTKRQNIKSFAGVPMLTNGEAVGVLCVNYRRRHSFDKDEQCVLGLAAQLAAVALRNAELNALSAELAVKEERDRLARQLHDSVAQYVSAIPLMADTALGQLAQQPRETAHWLERIQHAARQTMIEVRANLFEMVAVTPRGRNLRQALSEIADLAREYFKLEVQFTPQPIPDKLSIPIESELLLVCREAIVNAGRHAGAQRVMVELSNTADMVRVQIKDDGCGFDPSILSAHGQRGLKFMRQRVERMGGNLNIRSRPGQGTVIEAVIPA